MHHRGIPVVWNGTRLWVYSSLYFNGLRLALCLKDSEFAPYCTATVNMPEVPVPDGHVLIKNWGENRGILDVLQAAGIVGAPVSTVPAGFEEARCCPLLMEVPEDD